MSRAIARDAKFRQSLRRDSRMTDDLCKEGSRREKGSGRMLRRRHRLGAEWTRLGFRRKSDACRKSRALFRRHGTVVGSRPAAAGWQTVLHIAHRRHRREGRQSQQQQLQQNQKAAHD